ncbi:MAG: DUF1697 domain-containing protein [Calditrichaceae bacterium]|nr:DUF1697 domain-containing protein [Calditrichia bacterium]NUQ44257.1 DUF1697 domain-containing protein [Calditrichaceae bacterium]
MNTFVALFRGVNVGGKNSLPMKELVALLEDIGLQKIRTYIQSGNVVFQTTVKDTSDLAKRISAEIRKCFAFEAHVFLLRIEALDEAMAKNPFSEAEADPGRLHLWFLASEPKIRNLDKLNELKKDSERFYLGDKVFYLHAPEGVGRSRLAASVEKVLGVPMTARNWRTVCKIKELAEK